MCPPSKRSRAFAPIDRRSCALLIALVVAGVLVSGCQRVNYPDARATSVLGQSGVCQRCLKSIDSAQREQVVVFDAVQYTVCDDNCAAALKNTLDEQKGR